jgi:2,5-furandicarboxylate decarboxylase 1
MPYSDLRAFLSNLEGMGELRHIKKEVGLEYEIGAIGRKLDDLRGPAVVFENVKGYQHQVVMNIFGTTMKRMAVAMECEEDDLLKTWADRSRTFVKPRLVESGPCQENVLIGDKAHLTDVIPPIVWNECDGGPYITFLLFINKDPETGAGNMAMYRLMVTGDRRMGAFLQAPQHGPTAFFKAEGMGKPLEVAIVIGTDPVLYLASQVPLPYGAYELELAGGLRQEPVEVVKCKTVDLEVPATAEIVLEGRVLPNVREMEGPFGEFTGYIGPADMRPVIEISAITHRNDPYYLCTYEGYPPTEDHTIHSLTKSAELYQQIKQFSAPTLKDLYFPLGGCSAFHVVASLKKERAGQAKNVILDILKNALIKSCVVVDEDIDVRDSTQVEWAIATRVRPDQDIVIVSDIAGPHLDPLQHDGSSSSKYGIDATIPFGHPFPERVKPNEEAMRLVEANWSQYFSQAEDG